MRHRFHDTNRIHNFSDGVFGVAATVLILAVTANFRDDLAKINSEADIIALLGRLWWPGLWVWLVSVLVVGTFWIAHQNIFHVIVRADRWLLWCNTFFLMSVTVVPFPTAILAKQPNPTAILLYGATLIVCSFGLFLIWQRAVMNRDLFRHGVSDQLIRKVQLQILTGPLVYAVAIGLGYLWPRIAIAMIAGMQLIYMFPGNIDKHAALLPAVDVDETHS